MKRGKIMILTVDVGNSNTVIIGYEDTQKKINKRILTEKKNPNVYYYNEFESLQVNPSVIVLSCVVPMITAQVESVLRSLYPCDIHVVSAKTIQNFTIKLDQPEEIGADFIATAIGASAQFQSPIIVADIGSASKISVIDSDGSFLGGVIIPGLQTSLNALVEYIPQLPEVEFDVPQSVIGTNTRDCIQSGIMYGLITQIEGLTKKMEAELGNTCTKIITGGYAALIHKNLNDFIYNPDLLNDGLLAIYQKGYLNATGVFNDNLQ